MAGVERSGGVGADELHDDRLVVSGGEASPAVDPGGDHIFQ